MMFVNTMHSVCFYFINTAVMCEFAALFKFTYIRVGAVGP